MKNLVARLITRFASALTRFSNTRTYDVILTSTLLVTFLAWLYAFIHLWRSSWAWGTITTLVVVLSLAIDERTKILAWAKKEAEK